MLQILDAVIVGRILLYFIAHALEFFCVFRYNIADSVILTLLVLYGFLLSSPRNVYDHEVTTVADKGHSRTKSEITPQYHETRQQMGDSSHNFTIHATIPRFTPQFHDSRHNFTIHTTKKPLTNHGLNIH
jgi:hypothetical protein